MKKLFTLVLFLCSTTFAQQKFEIKNASKDFDVRISVAKCEDGFCEGKAKYSFFRKNTDKPFQVINLPDTQIWLDKKGSAQANVTLRYDEQSAVNFGDFNFDGFEDVAVCDGKNGGYGMPSYQVYLFSKQQNKFVPSPAFTKLGQGYLGMFEVDKKKKRLYAYSKDGCCWHQTEGFSIVGNRPKKVFEEVEDATIPDEKKVKITTKNLVGGRWRTSVKYVKREE